MKKIYSVEELSKYGEDIVAVRIENNEVYACGYIEENLNVDFPEYKNVERTCLRFMAHSNDDEWILDKHIYHGAAISESSSVPWLITAMSERQGEVSGDMYFHYVDPESWNTFKSVYEAFVNEFGYKEDGERSFDDFNEANNMFEMSNEEFSDIFDVLKPGVYIIAYTRCN